MSLLRDDPAIQFQLLLSVDDDLISRIYAAFKDDLRTFRKVDQHILRGHVVLRTFARCRIGRGSLGTSIALGTCSSMGSLFTSLAAASSLAFVAGGLWASSRRARPDHIHEVTV